MGSEECKVSTDNLQRAYRKARTKHCAGKSDEPRCKAILAAATEAFTLKEAACGAQAPAQLNPAYSSRALITWATPATVFDHAPGDWAASNWTNQPAAFWAAWNPGNVAFQKGKLTLTIDDQGCPRNCDGRPFKAGEIHTNQPLGPGYYEIRAQVAPGTGHLFGFFLFADSGKKGVYNEMDIEIGRSCDRAFTNYYSGGESEHTVSVPLGFDACTDFHNYGMKVTARSIEYYFDGRLARTVNLPAHESDLTIGKVFINFWPRKNLEGWLGDFKYEGPIAASVEWFKFSPLTTGAPDQIFTPLASENTSQ